MYVPVNSNCLLPKLCPDANKRAASVFLREQQLEIGRFLDCLLPLELLFNFSVFGTDVLIIPITIGMYAGKHLKCFVIPAFGEKPSRRLRQEPHDAEQSDSWDHLDADKDTPRRVTVNERTAVLN